MTAPNSAIGAVAQHLLGEPKEKLNGGHEWKYSGGLLINLDKGNWFDHSAGYGGGIPQLVMRERGGNFESAAKWLTDNGFQIPAGSWDERIEATYDYPDETGQPTIQVVRLRNPKDFRQRRREPDGSWTWKTKGIRKVPYQLPDLIKAVAKGHTVLIVEGEKDVDNLRRLNFCGTCNPGGAGKWRDEYNEYFRGADVVIAPDNDPQAINEKDGTLRFHPDGRPVFPGQDHANEVAAALKSVAKRVRWLELPNLPLKGDVSDWIEKGGTAEQLRDLIEKAPDWQAPTAPQKVAEPPRPLMRELPAAVRFPVEALGELLGNAALAIHDRAQNPIAICAQSVLAAASLSVMGHADVVLPIGRTVPISLFLLCLAVTGERKSTGDNLAMAPIEAYEKELRATYDLDLFQYQIACRAWEIAKEQIEKQGKGQKPISQSELRTKLEQHGKPPPAPIEPTMLTDEPTIQGLELHYKVGMPILGLFASEGGKFINGHSMADDKTKLRASTSLSDLWDGKPIRRMRAEGGSNYMPGRRLCMHLQVQPDIAAPLLADAALKSQGFMSRLLLAYPETMIGDRMQRLEKETTELYLAAYAAHIRKLLRADLPLADGKKNELEPHALEMSADAQALWRAFADAVEIQMKAGAELHRVVQFVNKLPEQAARIAAVLTLVETKLQAAEISAEHMVRGITLAKHYASEAVRLNEMALINTQLVKAEELLGWLQNEWTEPAVSLPDIYQLGPGSIRDATAAATLVGILIAHGWMEPVNGGATIRGHRRRVAWSVVRG
jgi:hypothetical protein